MTKPTDPFDSPIAAPIPMGDIDVGALYSAACQITPDPAEQTWLAVHSVLAGTGPDKILGSPAAARRRGPDGKLTAAALGIFEPAAPAVTVGDEVITDVRILSVGPHPFGLYPVNVVEPDA